VAGLLRFLGRRRRGEADFAAEIDAHLALETERLVAEGVPPADAAWEARRRFGNVGLAREAFHRRRASARLEALPRLLRHAARRLGRAPGFTVAATLTLTLGIGATTAVFSLVDGVLLRPLPWPRAAELVDLSHELTVQGVSRVPQSDGTYLYYRRANRVFSGIGAWRTVDVNLGAETGRDAADAERAEATRASASLFAVLGVAPLRGRVFRDDEDLPGAVPVVILSEALWRGRYGADPAIVGRRIAIDGVRREVVGVMPERFAFPDAGAALWLPIGIDAARTATAAFDYRAVARLLPGVTRAAAEADLRALLPRVPEAFPGRLTAPAIGATRMRPVVQPLRDVVVGGAGRALWIVLAAAAFLLLVACANVANLFLVRAEARGHELAVRRALGAGRGWVVAEFLAEGLLVAALGGALGVALAVAGLDALRLVGSAVAIPRLAAVALDAPVLAVAAGVTLLTAAAMSVLPAFEAYGAEAGAALARTGRRTTAGPRRHRVLRALVVAQVAVGLVLATGAGLMVRSFRSLRSVPLGFEPRDAYAFRVVLPPADFPTTAATVAFVTRTLDAIRAVPGVRSAGVVSKLPLEAEGRQDTAVFVADRPPTMGTMPVVHQVAHATPGSFAALGIPFVAGNAFAAPDPSVAPLEAVITRAVARRYWGAAPAVGKGLRLAPDGPVFTVVGVTGDVRGSGLDRAPDETIYVPLVTAPGPATASGGAADARWAPRELAFVVRGTGGDVIGAVERTIRDLAPAVPVYGAGSMADVVARSTARTSFTLALLEIAALAALAIGAVGLYGVASYMVGLRMKEMAVRTALGARPAALLRLVLGQTVSLAALGIVLGLGAALLLTRFLGSLVFGVSPTDPTTFAAAASLTTLVAAAASWVPARRAAAAHPAAALQGDL